MRSPRLKRLDAEGIFPIHLVVIEGGKDIFGQRLFPGGRGPDPPSLTRRPHGGERSNT
jgi:hypothetical protein